MGDIKSSGLDNGEQISMQRVNVIRDLYVRRSSSDYNLLSKEKVPQCYYPAKYKELVCYFVRYLTSS